MPQTQMQWKVIDELISNMSEVPWASMQQVLVLGLPTVTVLN